MVQPNFVIVRAHVYTSQNSLLQQDCTSRSSLQDLFQTFTETFLDKIDPCHTLYNDIDISIETYGNAIQKHVHFNYLWIEEHDLHEKDIPASPQLAADIAQPIVLVIGLPHSFDKLYTVEIEVLVRLL